MAFDLKQYASRVRLTDGAWGTQLHKLGLPPGSPGEIWNVAQPSAVEQVAAGYVQAGSDVILTNTLLANRFILAQHGVEKRVAELAEAGALISRRAADQARSAGRDVKVFASIGPTGIIVMMGEVPKDAVAAAFAETAEAVAFGGADAIVLETFNELDEIAIAIEAVRKVTDLPIVASMTFASGPDKTCTMMGSKPADLAATAKRLGASAVGANCGAGPKDYVKVAALLREASDLPVWIKANAGLPVMTRDGAAFPMGPDEFASFVPDLIRAGANFIGGCCGTTPDHIRAIRQAIDRAR